MLNEKISQKIKNCLPEIEKKVLVINKKTVFNFL